VTSSCAAWRCISRQTHRSVAVITYTLGRSLTVIQSDPLASERDFAHACRVILKPVHTFNDEARDFSPVEKNFERSCARTVRKRRHLQKPKIAKHAPRAFTENLSGLRAPSLLANSDTSRPADKLLGSTLDTTMHASKTFVSGESNSAQQDDIGFTRCLIRSSRNARRLRWQQHQFRLVRRRLRFCHQWHSVECNGKCRRRGPVVFIQLFSSRAVHFGCHHSQSRGWFIRLRGGQLRDCRRKRRRRHRLRFDQRQSVVG
jgi:hypothetical protein